VDTSVTQGMGDGMRRALLASHPRLSKFDPLPRILVFDEFDSGTHGWTELLANYDGVGNLDTLDDHMRDLRPPQLSTCTFFDIGSHGAMSGSYALKVATRPITGHTAVAIRRLTMAQRGLVQFETWFTYKTEAHSDENQAAFKEGGGTWDGNTHPSEQQFGAFTFGSDLCDADGVRYHCVVRYQNTDLRNRLSRRWMYPVVTEPTPKEHLADRLAGKAGPKYGDDFTAPNPDDWVTLGEPQMLCYNEVPTKVNWHYLRWRIDTARRQNVELQVNDRIYDMRDVPVPAYDDKYTSLENLLNFYVTARTHTDVRNFLFLDSILISVDW
jgi:hypothetical protein